MRALITCDSGDVVAGIVEFVVSQHATLRLLSRVLARDEAAPLAILLIVLNALRCYVGVYSDGNGRAVVAARRPNERRTASTPAGASRPGSTPASVQMVRSKRAING